MAVLLSKKLQKLIVEKKIGEPCGKKNRENLIKNLISGDNLGNPLPPLLGHTYMHTHAFTHTTHTRTHTKPRPERYQIRLF